MNFIRTQDCVCFLQLHVTSLKCVFIYSRLRWCSSVQPISSANRAIPIALAGSRCLMRKSQHALATSSTWYLAEQRRETSCAYGVRALTFRQWHVCTFQLLSVTRAHLSETTCYRSCAFTSWRPKEHATRTSLPRWCGRCRQSRWVFPQPQGRRHVRWPLRRDTLWSC